MSVGATLTRAVGRNSSALDVLMCFLPDSSLRGVMSQINDNLARAQTSDRLGNHRGVRYVSKSREMLSLIMTRLRITIRNPRNVNEAYADFSPEVRIIYARCEIISFHRHRRRRHS